MRIKPLLIALAALTLTTMNSCSNSEGSSADAVLENIYNRKSVRQFTSEPISDENIETMLRAAMAAPTAVNYQPWRFVVITEREQLDAIARAIAQAPPIILADEPTGNLDSGSTAEIMQIMKDLHKEGRTIILITHDNEIAARAERIIKIKDGRIESDTAEGVGEDEREEA